MMSRTLPGDGPFYDDLHPGYRFPTPPPVTLDAGSTAAYRMIVGEHWPPGLDHRLASELTGQVAPLVNPGLVLSFAIGASTIATRRVIANLFYRDVILYRPVHVGETLTTTTEVVAMSDASARTDGAPRGKVLLGITARTDAGVVVDFQRCALIPCRGDVLPGYVGDIGTSHGRLDLARFDAAAPSWDVGLLTEHDPWAFGDTRVDALRDVVDQATALVRLTHNVAAVHRDATATVAGDRRLVYGGHTVGLAQASLERTLDGLATLVGWHECNHVGPVYEGDLLGFRHTVVAEQSRATGRSGRLRAIRVEAVAYRAGDPVVVLDWTPVVLTS
jgi:2-methylfumaryl-CoA hydratase